MSRLRSSSSRGSSGVLFLALLVSLAYTLTVFDWGFLSGAGPYWDQPQIWDLDRAQALIGWRYFARDAWRLPVFRVPTLGYPEGVNIVFTDSIPLLALPFKVVYKLTGHEINYLGPWMLLCYVLQGVAAAALAYALGIRAWAANLSTVLVGLCATILLRRFGHGALCAHFLLLYALWGYVTLVEEPHRPWRWAAMVAVLAAAILVTAYFAVMVAAIGAAALLESLRRRTLSPTLAAGVLASAAVAVTGVMYGGGLIGPGAPSAAGGGYARFSMNALAPFFGDEFSYTQRLFGPITVDATGGQYEGFTYLGGGTLLLGLSACVIWPRRLFRALRSHLVLTMTLAGLSLYALSNVVFVGGTEVLRLALPPGLERVTSAFRSSGRFFWPVYYAVTFGLMAFLWHRLPRRAGIAVLIAVAVLHYAETRTLRVSVATAARQVNAPWFVDDKVGDLVQRAERLFVYPSFECARDDPDWPKPSSWRAITVELMLRASRRAMPSNSMYVNRGQKDCMRERQSMPDDGLESGTLYVVRLADSSQWDRLLRSGGTCVVKEPALVCGNIAPAAGASAATSSRRGAR